MSLLSAKEIMEIIPHRQPFLLIDRIEELEPGKELWERNASRITSRFSTGIFRRSRSCRAS